MILQTSLWQFVKFMSCVCQLGKKYLIVTPTIWRSPPIVHMKRQITQCPWNPPPPPHFRGGRGYHVNSLRLWGEGLKSLQSQAQPISTCPWLLLWNKWMKQLFQAATPSVYCLPFMTSETESINNLPESFRKLSLEHLC